MHLTRVMGGSGPPNLFMVTIKPPVLLPTYVLHLFKVVIIFSEAGEVNISLVVSVVRADVMI